MFLDRISNTITCLFEWHCILAVYFYWHQCSLTIKRFRDILPFEKVTYRVSCAEALNIGVLIAITVSCEECHKYRWARTWPLLIIKKLVEKYVGFNTLLIQKKAFTYSEWSGWAMAGLSESYTGMCFSVTVIFRVCLFGGKAENWSFLKMFCYGC